MESGTVTPVDLDGFRTAMRAAGVEEIVDTTLEIYVEEAGSLFDDLVEAWRAGDVAGVRAGAHTLKSSSGNIHATGLAEMFAALEAAAETPDEAAIASTMPELQTEFERVMAFLGAQKSG